MSTEEDTKQDATGTVPDPGAKKQERAAPLGVAQIAVRQVNAVLPRVAETSRMPRRSSSLGNRSAPALDSAPVTSPAVVVRRCNARRRRSAHGDPVFVLHEVARPFTGWHRVAFTSTNLAL